MAQAQTLKARVALPQVRQEEDEGSPMRGGAQPEARVFPITERRINYIVKATAKRAGINPATSAHWLRHADASHAIDGGAPITLVSQTLGHRT